MVRKNKFSDHHTIWYACGGADGRLPTWSIGSSCRFRSGNFIVKNYGHGDPHLCVCVCTTRRRGTWCEECCSLQVAMLWNNHIHTTLQTCWRTFFLEISAGRWTGQCSGRCWSALEHEWAARWNETSEEQSNRGCRFRAGCRIVETCAGKSFGSSAGCISSCSQYRSNPHIMANNNLQNASKIQFCEICIKFSSHC